jgi:multidrug efflux pump subunit AcrB
MKLSNFSIRRGITVTMIYLILIGAGIFGLSSLKIDLYPISHYQLSPYSAVIRGRSGRH